MVFPNAIDLFDAVKVTIGLDRSLTVSESETLIQIHRTYLKWDDPSQRHPRFRNFYTDKDIMDVKRAIKNFRIALSECGDFGQWTAQSVKEELDSKLQYISFLEKHYGDTIAFFPELGLKWLPPRGRGNPGNTQLRVYIFQMAGWYQFFFKGNLAWGTGSKFPRLIGACLPVIDQEWDDKEPPYKVTGLCTILRVFSRNGLSM